MTSLILDFMLVSEIIKGRSLESLVGQLVGAIAVKAVILVLGALGDVGLWAAVFADVGVALLAVANSMRILWRRYR